MPWTKTMKSPVSPGSFGQIPSQLSALAACWYAPGGRAPESAHGATGRPHSVTTATIREPATVRQILKISLIHQVRKLRSLQLPSAQQKSVFYREYPLAR